MEDTVVYALVHEQRGEECFEFHEIVRVYDDLQAANDAARTFLAEEYGTDEDESADDRWGSAPYVVVRSDGTVHVEAIGVDGETVSVWVQAVPRRGAFSQ